MQTTKATSAGVVSTMAMGSFAGVKAATAWGCFYTV